MMKKLLLGILMISSAGHASTYNLQDLGSSIIDNNSGLEWLDTSFTLGKSYNEVLGMIGAGNSLEGWRFATYDEFRSIFTSRGYSLGGGTVKLGVTTGVQSNDPFFQTLIDLLGATYSNTTANYVMGLTGDDYKNGRLDAQYYGLIKSGVDRYIDNFASIEAFEDSKADSKLASFLVRGVSPVPEADSWLLLFTGLMLVGISLKTRRA